MQGDARALFGQILHALPITSLPSSCVRMIPGKTFISSLIGKKPYIRLSNYPRVVVLHRVPVRTKNSARTQCQNFCAGPLQTVSIKCRFSNYFIEHFSCYFIGFDLVVSAVQLVLNLLNLFSADSADPVIAFWA